MKKKFFLTALVNSLISIALIFFAFQPRFSAAEDIAIVAVVNDDVITSQDLDETMRYMQSSAATMSQARQPRPALTSSDRKTVLEELIRDRLFDQEMKRLGIVISSMEIDQEIEQIAQRSHVSSEQMKKELQERNISLQQYRESIADHIRLHKFIARKIRSKIQIDDHDIAEYYQARAKAAARTGKATEKMRLLQISNKHPLDASQRKAAVEIASKGNDTADLAELKKIDADFSVTDFGSMSLDELNPEMQKTLTRLSADGVSEIFDKGDGWYFYKVMKQFDLDLPPLDDEMKNQIKAMLFEKVVQEELNVYIGNLRRTAHVEVRI